MCDQDQACVLVCLCACARVSVWGCVRAHVCLCVCLCVCVPGWACGGRDWPAAQGMRCLLSELTPRCVRWPVSACPGVSLPKSLELENLPVGRAYRDLRSEPLLLGAASQGRGDRELIRGVSPCWGPHGRPCRRAFMPPGQLSSGLCWPPHRGARCRLYCELLWAPRRPPHPAA